MQRNMFKTGFHSGNASKPKKEGHSRMEQKHAAPSLLPPQRASHLENGLPNYRTAMCTGRPAGVSARTGTGAAAAAAAPGPMAPSSGHLTPASNAAHPTARWTRAQQSHFYASPPQLPPVPPTPSC
eukprot:1150646-Pelagomonas_calceolata.AAC.2